MWTSPLPRFSTTELRHRLGRGPTATRFCAIQARSIPVMGRSDCSAYMSTHETLDHPPRCRPASRARQRGVVGLVGVFDDRIDMPAAGWIALVLGTIATIALGGGLMFLLFYSSRRGYDDIGGPGRPDDAGGEGRLIYTPYIRP